jgi:hypothetical protein
MKRIICTGYKVDLDGCKKMSLLPMQVCGWSLKKASRKSTKKGLQRK